LRIRFSESKTLLASLLVSVVAVACSSAGGEPTGETMQATTCLPGGPDPSRDGIHVQTCTITPPPPTFHVLECATSTGCSISAPEPAGEFTAPRFAMPETCVPTGNTGGCTPQCALDTTLTTELAAMKCTPQRTIIPPGGTELQSFNISFCPQLPTDTNSDWAEITCWDTCSGEPPAGWVIVGWMSDQACNGQQPGSGCAAGGCLRL
jgi:hypothetical protein